MPLTSYNQAIEGLRDTWTYLYRSFTNNPAPAYIDGVANISMAVVGFASNSNYTYPNTINGRLLFSNTANAQAIYRVNPPANTYAYIGRIETQHQTQSAHDFLVIDKIWQGSLLNVGGNVFSSTIGTPTWPERDNNGTSNGDGFLIKVDWVSGTANTRAEYAPRIFVGYTNSDGVPGRTASNVAHTNVNIFAMSSQLLALEGNDIGVRSIDNISFSSAWSHTWANASICVFRPLTHVRTVGGSMYVHDPLSILSPRIYDGACLSFIYTSGAGGGFHYFGLDETWANT